MLNNTICLLTLFQEGELISLSGKKRQKVVQLKGEPGSLSVNSLSPGCGRSRDIYLFVFSNRNKASVTEQLKLDIKNKKAKQN